MKRNFKKLPQQPILRILSSKAPSMACGKSWKRPESARMTAYKERSQRQKILTGNFKERSTLCGRNWKASKPNTKKSFRRTHEWRTPRTRSSKAPLKIYDKSWRKPELPRMIESNEPSLKQKTLIDNSVVRSTHCGMSWNPFSLNMRNNYKNPPRQPTMRTNNSRAQSTVCGSNWKKQGGDRKNDYRERFPLQKMIIVN